MGPKPRPLTGLTSEQPDMPPLPHEQDDPALSTQTGFTKTYQFVDPQMATAAQSQVMGQSQFAGTPTTPGSWLNRPAPLTQSGMIRTVVEGGKPNVSFDDNDGSVVLTMEGGREVLFASTSGAPVFVDGNQRRFRLTKDEAQELTRQLARMLAKHAED